MGDMEESYYADQLLRKAKTIVDDYKLKISLSDSDSTPLDAQQMHLYESMKRWHTNAHVSRAEWRRCFDNISNNLDVKESMSIEEDLQQFLQSKFKKASLKNMFSISPLLDFLEDDIRKLYHVKLDTRLDTMEDEFNQTDVFDRMKPEDVTHLEKVFMPAAYFYTYLEKHSGAARLDLMNDIFTLGSGSRTASLFPEVTGICDKCSNNAELSNVSETNIDSYNRGLFKLQLKHRFTTSFRIMVSSSDDGSSFDEKLYFKEDTWYNPFDSTSSSSGTTTSCARSLAGVESDRLDFECQDCTKSFTKKEYLDFHRECFHKTALKCGTQFVADPTDLISSFTHEDEAGTSKALKCGIQFVGDPPDLISSFTHVDEAGSSSGIAKKVSKKVSKKDKIQQETRTTRQLRNRPRRELKFSK